MPLKRRNSISGQFAARLIEMLESPAYRVLSRSAHMIISRVEIELANHGGNDNGRLPITTEDFIAYGMDRSSIAPAIREAEALGFIRIERESMDSGSIWLSEWCISVGRGHVATIVKPATRSFERASRHLVHGELSF
jgi:hypothetical protein